MLSHNKVVGPIELQEAIFDGDTVSEAVQIEEVLNRAHEIHRAHGGLIGYDLEDWLQAERELAQKPELDHFKGNEAGHAEPLPWNQERNCQQCFGLNN
jgi:hypothetical protein